jgi:protein ImuB
VIGVDPAAPRSTQGGLFLAGFPDPEKWELMLARLANLVGEANVGSPELMDTHFQGEFRMEHFATIGEEKAGRSPKEKKFRQEEKDETPSARGPATGFRVFRPPFAAKVELREECPVRIAFCGVRAEVIGASGPWRTSGNWWEEGVWQHDEWDIEIRCDALRAVRLQSRPARAEQNPGARSEAALRDGMYRIYYDGLRRSWFVRGAYD